VGPFLRAAEHHKGLVLLGLARGSDKEAARAVATLGRDRLVGSASFPDDAATADALVAKGLGDRGDGKSPTTSRSPVMLALMNEARRVAASRLPVLVRGETGAGKEVVARAIHDASPRREARFLALNCGAFAKSLLEAQLFGHERGAFTGANKTTKGAFELADGGTLFLDEVGELSPEAQAALLRVLETKRLVRIGGDEEITVDVRVVTATHRDLEAMARDGAFREDLLYRLDGATLSIPPLRERPEDVEALATRFVAEACATDGLPQRALSLDTLAVLLEYPFPGNVRELRNAMTRAAVVAEGATIEPRDLPEKMRRSSTAPRPAGSPHEPADAPAAGDYKERVRAELQRIETRMITEALANAQGNQTVAARALNLPLRTLTHKIRELGIKKTFG
jgi:transcriptional regulator with GAF, ATPase, and Fis domain